ncbi:MAG: glycosyltransferase family 4 protein [Bacteroidetes bacterium]|nr:glycosyltransferase family 4 protein [Bacteroidota bacterium]
MVVTHFLRKSSQIGTPFITNQILNLQSYAPSIVYKQDTGANRGFAEFDWNNFPTLNLSEGKGFQFNFYFFKKIGGVDCAKVLNFLKEKKSRLTHFHFGTDAYIYADVMAKSGLPSVISFYGHDVSFFRSLPLGLGHPFFRQAIQHATKILAMSPYMKEQLMNYGCPENKILIHYHGIPTNFFQSIKREHLLSEQINLLLLGRLDYSKGHIFLFRALKKMIATGIKNFKLNVVGSGHLEKRFRNLSNKYGLDQFVHFAGPVKYLSDEMSRYFSEADIFVHPCVPGPGGFREGIPGTIVEAMASGLPVISTYHAGIPYVIENEKTGLLVEEWDVDALANAIKRLMEDHLLRKKLGEAARIHACANLDLIKKEQELEAIYDSLL